jgi:hypothetical protein
MTRFAPFALGGALLLGACSGSVAKPQGLEVPDTTLETRSPAPGTDGITAVPAEVVLDVLLYHVAEGRRAANSVLPRQGVRTITPLLGETFQVRTNGTIRDGLTGVRESDATIVAADISASNGIIHVISEVIVPPSIVAALTGN